MGLLFADAWAFLTIPLTATIIHGAAIWIWHWPALFEAALVTPAIHRLQHVSFIVTAVLFWWALLQRRARVTGYGPAVFYLFATALHTGFLGVLLAFAKRPLYPVNQACRALGSDPARRPATSRHHRVDSRRASLRESGSGIRWNRISTSAARLNGWLALALMSGRAGPF